MSKKHLACKVQLVACLLPDLWSRDTPGRNRLGLTGKELVCELLIEIRIVKMDRNFLERLTQRVNLIIILFDTSLAGS